MEWEVLDQELVSQVDELELSFDVKTSCSMESLVAFVMIVSTRWAPVDLLISL